MKSQSDPKILFLKTLQDLKTPLRDPRFQTRYASSDPHIMYFRNVAAGERTLSMPPFVEENWCEPGYQPQRRDKGYALTVNDYPFHDIFYGGGLWPQYVITPLVSDN